MSNKSPDEFVICNELRSTYHVIAETYSHLESAPVILTLFKEVMNESHFSGNPSYVKISCIVDLLRVEKLRFRRNRSAPSPVETDIQSVITRLKLVRATVGQDRPNDSSISEHCSPGWWQREWETISYAIPVFPSIYAAILIITAIAMCFFDVTGLAILITLGSLISFFICISLVLKDAGSIEMLIIMAVSLVLVGFLFMLPTF